MRTGEYDRGGEEQRGFRATSNKDVTENSQLLPMHQMLTTVESGV